MEIMDAIEEWRLAEVQLALAMGKLPQWYRDRLAALERLKVTDEITAAT
jgi:hypothetical protein